MGVRYSWLLWDPDYGLSLATVAIDDEGYLLEAKLCPKAASEDECDIDELLVVCPNRGGDCLSEPLSTILYREEEEENTELVNATLDSIAAKLRKATVLAEHVVEY